MSFTPPTLVSPALPVAPPTAAQWQAWVLAALIERDPASKVAATQALPPPPLSLSLVLNASNASNASNAENAIAESALIPGRPDAPQLLVPQQVPWRDHKTAEGMGALIHAIAHIEFNAINLALDALWRYPGLPPTYYADWLKVAQEEAHHFTLLAEHLLTLGYAYGHFPAHNGLWEMAEKTKGDFVARMALVPRLLEARGLDATPPILKKLIGARSSVKRGAAIPHAAAIAILQTILADEVGHVAIGNHWYRWACARENLAPEAHFEQLLKRFDAPRPRPPFNAPARLQAGFTESELASWSEQPVLR